MGTRIATAEWADPALVEDKYRYRDGDVWLGRSPTEKQIPIGYRDDRHVCLVSGSRAGKGASSIINNLSLWPGSVVVVDPKGENATVTAARRGKGSPNCDGLGQAVHVLDPFKAAQVDETYRSRFNPLDALNPENEETIDEAGRIADAIVVIHEDSKDPFWDESARAMVKGLILHVLTAPEYEGRRNLVTLRKLITRGDWEAVELLRDDGEKDIPPAHALLWTGVVRNPAFEGLVAGIGDTFANMFMNGPKQFESVLQVANRNTEFIDSPAMQRTLEASDFELAGLKNKPQGMSLYLCLPQRFMSTHYRWLRMMIALTVTEMEIVRGRPATGFPVLMVLDEFAGLKRMEVIEHAVAQIAGYGVKLFFVLQSLEQLKAVYKDNWETFLSNSGLRIFFSLDDHFSREYVSKLVGETEVIREVRSASESESESESVSHSTGSSVTRGRSVSEGTNRSASDSLSGGANSSVSRSKGRSWGQSWTPKGFFGIPKNEQDSRGRNFSTSTTEGTSRGWSHSDTEGTSYGTSDSYGSGTSETDGTTRGTSRSRTMGASETIHRRALVTPDEIGHFFARISDVDRTGYPGLALVIISGERAIALRRVNYFEDYEFARRFEPHPDYPSLPAWKNLSVGILGLHPFTDFLVAAGVKREIGGWLVNVGEIVSSGESVASLRLQGSTVHIRSPYAGMITKLRGDDSKGAFSSFFSLRYVETQGQETYPFTELLSFVRQLTERARLQAAGATRSLWIMAAVGVLSVFALIATQYLGLLVFIGIMGVLISRKAVEIGKCNRILGACPQGLLDGPGTGNSQDPLGFRAWKVLEELPALEVAPAALPPAAAIPAEVPAAVVPAAQEMARETAQATASAPGEIAAPAGAPSSEPLPVQQVVAAASRRSEDPPERARRVALFSGIAVAAVVLVVMGLVFRANKQTDEHGAGGGAGAVNRDIKKPQLPPVSSPSRDAEGPDNSPGALLRLTPAYTLPTAVVNSLAFRPDGRLLATAGLAGVRLWDVATGQEIATLTEGSWHSVSFSPDGHLLASGGVDEIKLWDVTSAALDGPDLSFFRLPGHKTNLFNKRFVQSVAFSPDSRFLASGDGQGTIKVEEVSSGNELVNIPGQKVEYSRVAISPNGQALAYTRADGAIELSDVKTGQEIRMLTEHRGPWMSLAFSPDGHLLASTGKGAITLWDVSTGRVARTLTGHTSWVNSAAFSPDGIFLASGSDDKTTKLWDVASGKEIGTTLTRNNGEVVPVAFSPDGRLLAVSIVPTGNAVVKLWHVPAR